MNKELNITPKASLILFVVILIMTVVFSSVSRYESYKNSTALKDEQIQSMLLNQQKELSELKEEIDILRFESDGKVGELERKLIAEEKLREAIETERESQNIVSQQQISNLEKKLSQTNSSIDLTTIIKNWQPLVAFISCDFKLGKSNVHYGSSGSGVAIRFGSDPVKIITNRHVVLGPSLYSFNSCTVKLPDSDLEFSVFSREVEISVSEYDWAKIIINNPDQNLKNITNTFLNICQKKPSLGDQVVVLGYPSIGSIDSVTATEGIISGFDGDYFITSAKVEQGNSGGAAILVKDNCLLGIPTFASLGEVESLARILDIWTILVK